MNETDEFPLVDKIKELEKRIDTIKVRYRFSILAVLFLLLIWIIVFQTADGSYFAILVSWGSAIGLALGSFVAITVCFYIVKFVIFLVKPEPGAPLVSKEEREEAEWEKVRLTACPNCMLVYDSRKTVCPDCGNKTIREEKIEESEK